MGRAWRIEHEGGLYHVLPRGNDRKDFLNTTIFTHNSRCDTKHIPTRLMCGGTCPPSVWRTYFFIGDPETQNSWVIARRQLPLGINRFNAWVETVSRILPVVDIWPIRYASSFKLMKGKKPLDPGDKDFYQNYKAVGSFPALGDQDGDKIIGAWMVKSFFGFVTPLL